MAHLEYKFTLGDSSWTVDIGALTVDDWIDLKTVTTYNPPRLTVAFDDMDPLALKSLVWLARRKSGEDVAWDDPTMAFVLSELRIKVLRDTTKQDAQEGEKPVPTKAPRAPKTRTSKTK